jgi:3-oxoacyl-[acyl-carrier protein] reductase
VPEPVRTTVVTGASGAIGRACALALGARAGERLVLVGRDRARLAETADGVGPGAVPVVADLNEPGAADAVADAVGADGELHAVVLAAGEALRATVADAAPEDVERVVRTNLVAPLLLLHRLLRLRWERPAAIVAVGSLSATRPLAGRAIYGGSKAGLEQALRGLAVELAPRGIAVNVVSPGVVDTAMIAGVRRDVQAWAEARVPVGRIGRADEVATVVRFLCLGAPAYLTGARIPVDGGAEVAP